MKTCRYAERTTSRRSRLHTYLDDHLHEVLLGNDVFAAHDLLQDAWQYVRLVHLQVDAFELAEPDEVRADENPQVLPLDLALLPVARMALVLQAHPELVHLDEVGKDERDGVLQVPLGSGGREA